MHSLSDSACAGRQSAIVPETDHCFIGTQNKDKLQHNAQTSWTNVGNIWYPEEELITTKGQPSETQTTQIQVPKTVIWC